MVINLFSLSIGCEKFVKGPPLLNFAVAKSFYLESGQPITATPP